MPETVADLNWASLVGEALRRRKAEHLTQREHAALAGVSIPTIAAFDRGAVTLTLAKALDILRVVGLVEDGTAGDTQDRFVREALGRWRGLISKLPEGAAGRFPSGCYRFDYCLEGAFRELGLPELGEVLKRVGETVGWLWDEARVVDGGVEGWLDGGTGFWRAAVDGRVLVLRGYQEDVQETFPAGAIFDTTLPIWRMGEGLLHAARLGGVLRRDEGPEISVRFRAVYAGLSGRMLRAWANPLSDLLVEGHAGQGDEAVLEVVVPLGRIEADLGGCLFPMVASLFDRFGVTGVSVKRVQGEVERLMVRKGKVAMTRDEMTEEKRARIAGNRMDGKMGNWIG